MSSATSIDPAEADRLAPSGAKEGTGERRDSLRPWHFFVMASLMAATAAVVLARESTPEHLVLISLTIGAAGFAAATLYRTLAPLVAKEAVLRSDGVSESMRAVLEREKMLVLRSIKELEFDRAMGKVSTKDFEEMSARLRARAMSLMRQLDSEAGYRELIERELRARVNNPAVARDKPAKRVPAAVARPCECGAANDPDAAFCKRCGLKLAPGIGG